MNTPLAGKRILITQASEFMGPTLCEMLAEQGASVIASHESLAPVDAAARVVAAAGHIDILIANLAISAPTTFALEVAEPEWREVFATLVDPLPRLARAVLPAMLERRAGKILVMGSASALRGMKRCSTYSAARGAQLAWVQALGVEVASQQVQVQNFRNDLAVKSLWGAWWAPAKTVLLWPIYAAMRPIVLWGRCFPWPVAG